MLNFLTKRSDWLILLGILFTGGGVFCACYLPGRWQNATALAREPQRITLHELATKGPGDNPHVIVTDFTCGSGYAFQIQTRKGAPPPTPDQTGHGKGWIPLFPKSGPENANEPEPKSFVVLLETRPTLASGTGFHILSRRSSMEGLVIPLSRRGLSPEVRSQLAASYPDTDFESCLILEEYDSRDKEDAPVWATILTIGVVAGLLIGLPTLVLGIALFWRRRNQILSGAADRKVARSAKKSEAIMASSSDARSDPHDLNRFLLAQANDYEQALAEIKSGRKRTHWMWHVFPQFDGLGFSSTARHYAIKSIDEARAYLAHPILGSRLVACAEAAVRVEGRTAHDIFGSPDDLKLKSCATLFACVAPPGSVFDRLLAKYYQGERDGKTLELLGIGDK